MPDTCSTCRHWELEGQGNAAMYGRCRANPPQAHQVETEPGKWPITLETDVCGHHAIEPRSKPVITERETRPASAPTRRRKA